MLGVAARMASGAAASPTGIEIVKPNAVNCVKGEIHNVLYVMRLNRRWASEARFKVEIPLQVRACPVACMHACSSAAVLRCARPAMRGACRWCGVGVCCALNEPQPRRLCWCAGRVLRRRHRRSLSGGFDVVHA
jgi:hypothetical protein